MYRLEFEIRDLPKMANIESGKSHWRYAEREVKKWRNLVWLTVRSKKPPEPLVRVKLTLIRFSSSEPDYDGLVRGFKSVVDGLRVCGVLKDDRLKNTGPWDCHWQYAPRGKGFIRVTVVEATEDVIS
jgi:Holliday junction resolvase RusA-like endonuclease